MTLAQAVGKRTQELLFSNNMTQYRLTKITCLNEKTLSDLIKGKTTDVKFSTIYLISNAFEISLVEFFNSPLFKEENIEIWDKLWKNKKRGACLFFFYNLSLNCFFFVYWFFEMLCSSSSTSFFCLASSVLGISTIIFA